GVRSGSSGGAIAGLPTGAAPPAATTESAQSKIPALAVKGLSEPRSVPLTYSAPTLDGARGATGGAGVTRTTSSKTGTVKTATVSGTATQSRNSLCACGSGKKFKHCHGAPGRA
ncbi:MAG: SEC-C metal-binding domain-containing protein, partial [Actinomycetota bacterium]|nr:SEC-C metal-binding domain-containing protein [Actinomycetota bacterium]